jgi:hypothetical protein
MDEGKNRYEKAVKIIRKSKPVLSNPGVIEDAVMSSIRDKEKDRGMLTGLVESIYGWIYIGWVRRSLVGAALIIFTVFVYQQADILRSVRSLEKEIVSIRSEQPSVNVRDLERRLTVFKISSKISTGRKIEVYESQLQEIIDSYKNLEQKYENLNRIIEEDSLLKNYFENKLKEEENNRSKI